jgi:alpha-L-fucosidase
MKTSHLLVGRLPVFCSLLFLVHTASAQMVYPPETHAIPIPEMKDLPLAGGPFKGTVESLKQFQPAGWFQDGKFGIWAHWGPQAVAGDGDWYAHRLYQEGKFPYEDHLQTYGPPSKVGYKDIIPLWKAEKWDPEELMKLYKAAGAHYFVAQAVHHDNFDNWNSTYQKWNSVNMGPHKDIVGLWQKAAKEQGLPFGVSEHLGHSFQFMQVSHSADKHGDLAGVPYDGANPAYWDLYQVPALPGDTGWYSTDPRWAQEWYARIYDVVTQYKPDLLYSDGGVPYGQAGLNVIAQLYNLSVQEHGKLDAVYCCKKNYSHTEYFDGICAQDIERGEMDDIQPFAWQTDTSTGDWYYNRKDHYKTADEVIPTLVDIVSKNGNLLLNVVLYPDGSLPPEMETFLTDMAAWMKVNGEAIFGTRPWTIYGEGSTKVKGGAFKEGTHFSAADVRYTRKGDDIYITTLGLPADGKIFVRALASGSPLVTGEPTGVTLLGSSNDVKWSRTPDGLSIELPGTLPCKSALCVRISGLSTVAGLSPDTLDAFKNKLNTLPGPGQ